MNNKDLQHPFKKILFLDDISRNEFWPAKEFFYDMLRLVIKQSSNIVVPSSLRKQLDNHPIIANKLKSISWIENYHILSQDYIDILDKFILDDTLIIGYEMPPSLIKFLTDKKLDWIDFRISPIRFLPDLVIAIRSSLDMLNECMAKMSLSRSEVELEAIKLAASFRHNENYQMLPVNKDDVVFIIGQTPRDASLINNNDFITLDNFKEKIEGLIQNKRVIYLPHPSSDQTHIQTEVSFLQKINSEVSIGKAALYDTFCKEDNAIFVGISSGGLQEAIFFGKEAITLFQPICDVIYRHEIYKTNTFWQIGFSDFLSTEFWKMILLGNVYSRKTSINALKQNELRKLHNVWWGYSAIDVRNDNIMYQSSLNSELKIKQILEFCLKKPSINPNDNYNFSGGEYFWNDRTVKFSLDGKIYCRNIEEGSWYLGNASEKNIIIIWKYGFWIDKAYPINNGQALNCINNIGDKFIIKRTKTLPKTKNRFIRSLINYFKQK